MVECTIGAIQQLEELYTYRFNYPTTPIIVSYEASFASDLAKADEGTKNAVVTFHQTLITKGFSGLPGRNKPSWLMPRRIKDKAAKKQFATEHCLHHYHIGVPNYTPSSDGGVSDKYLHYQLFTNENGKMEARFVGIDNHNPFKPPEQSRLVKP